MCKELTFKELWLLTIQAKTKIILAVSSYFKVLKEKAPITGLIDSWCWKGLRSYLML